MSAAARRSTPLRLPALLAVIAAIVVGAVAPGPAPAAADPIPVTTLAPTAPAAPPSPEDALTAITFTQHAADASAFDLLAAIDGANQAVTVLQRANTARATEARRVSAAKATVSARQRTLTTYEQRLRLLSTQAYVSGGGTPMDQVGAVLDGDTTDEAGRARVMFDQVVHHQSALVTDARRNLATARTGLARAQRRLAAAQVVVEDAGATVRDRYRIRSAAEAARTGALAAQGRAKDHLRAAARGPVSMVPLTMPLQGDPVLDAEDLAGWFESSGYHSALPTPIVFFAQWFIDEGRQEGMRGDIAFAQAVIETGGFTNHDSVAYNNYSGIGHCDTCAGGWPFATPQLGVRAQIQLLKSYAVKHPVYVNPLVDKRLHGPAGCCPTWGDLTRVWATAPNYGPVVMGLYSELVGYALRRHAYLMDAPAGSALPPIVVPPVAVPPSTTTPTTTPPAAGLPGAPVNGATAPVTTTAPATLFP